MTKKLSNIYIKEILKENELIWISGEYKNNTTPIICENIDGYKVSVTMHNLFSGKTPAPFSVHNPHTLENIKIFLSKNNPNIELLCEEYIKSDERILCRCKVDGNEWYTSWEKLFMKSGCPKCSYKKRGDKYRYTIEKIRNMLKNINSDIEIISNYYETAKTSLTLRCKKDSYEWNADWNRISQGVGCPKCSFINLGGSYNEKIAERKKKEWVNDNAKVYVIRCFNEKENFYKIGVTKRLVGIRFIRKKEMPYNYETLYEFDTNLYDAIYIEKFLHKEHYLYRYLPSIKFDGYTECFSSINFTTVENYFKEGWHV